MAAPNGGLAKLFMLKESTWGTAPTLTNAHLFYFDSFTPQNDRTPIDFKEIQGGAAAVDHVEFVEGGIEVGGSMVYTVRYAGQHAYLAGLCMGTTTTTTAGSTHACALADDLASVTLGWQPPSTSTDIDDHEFLGMMVQSCTWSHRAGEPMKHSVNFMGKSHSFDVSLQSTGSMTTPSEDIIQWHDKEIDSGSDTGIEIEVQGSAPVELNCTDWELTLDNALVRRFIIQNGRVTAQPARDGKRTVTLRMTIDKDAGWREFQTAMGASSTTDTTDCDVRLRYEDNADSGLKWEALVANCRVTSAPAIVADDGFLTETVEMRAHYQSGGQNQDDALTIDFDNGDATSWDISA